MALDIGMSELVSNEVAVAQEQGSQNVRGAARCPQSDAGLVSDPLLCPDENNCGVAHNPPSGVSRVNNSPLRGPRDAVDRRSRHHGRSPGDAGGVEPIPLSEGYGPHGSELRVSRDTDSSLRTDGAVSPWRGDGDVTTLTSSGRHVELHCLSRWTPRQTSSTLVNGVTGGIDGDISLDSLPAVNTLLELDEMSIAEFGEALKAGDLAEVVMIRPEEALNPSSVVDEAVLENTKKELSARSGSAILKDPSDPFYPVLQEYTDVVS
ncbi:hypothetical protein PC123_g8538 [Phytophthora cactorum]|nr:hypothetical protein PC123_g8538 [Phytophthora cactorum]